MHLANVKLKEQEEKFAKQLLDAGLQEMKHHLYPTDKNFIYDGLNRDGLLRCYRTFYNDDKSDICSIITFGERMCGHRGILHGGASASVLDQFFGLMMCLLDIQGFTGQLQLSYRKIILCPSTVLIRGSFLKEEGRKHYFKAVITDEVGDICVEAECLFIQSDVKKILDRALNKLQ
ncbi:thioesterase superfamily protein [Blastocystis sp. subtype 4]|uniref:thioesterase superfamily protein n=1 Tax=Blastocystis sp. subtype 4 TaxID=944170 RepID=UPI0007121FB1|nr:thioesterase superfamily protein [Blastocystis sp. subtype 4]KNB45520.1 thioesterase superfamily protein [Blastocystis sp. subtype 4]|eukprot:XP_014528963.1 thioesterase superfamily protein [Blastocystis sp. subtype 4]